MASTFAYALLFALLCVATNIPQARSQLPTVVPTISRVEVGGLLSCSVNGNVPPAAPGVGGANATLSCNGSPIAQVLTNSNGSFLFNVNASSPAFLSLITNPSNCSVTFALPLANCSLLAGLTGLLQAPLSLLGLGQIPLPIPFPVIPGAIGLGLRVVAAPFGLVLV